MTPEQYDEIQAAFLRLRELNELQLGQEFRNLPEAIQQEVRILLDCDRECDGFLEPDPTAIPESGSAHRALSHSASEANSQSWMDPDGKQASDETEAETHADEQPGHLGPYRLLQTIGEGGFGTVYMAEQLEPVRRKVAIKVIKPGMDSKQVLARFHAERQALAMMDHPSIATVLDGGCSPQGAPYFVMELVRGIPINEFCDHQQLNLHERLKLFCQVCRAVHHAHQKGVIHRDLKPSNILVAMGEGEPIAKVIDFGIAKALDARLTEQTLFTEYGQMIGTLEFMSPEQAEMSAVDIDTRSDVYSLGVILFQLLTGETPIPRDELLRNGVFDVPRMIRETEHATPSKRVTSRQSQVSSIPRQAPAKGLGELVRGDLDWITMKALAKDRRRRYDSARDLSLDVDRFIQNQPVEAHPPSTWYRISKFARRHRIAVLAASAILLGLTVGMTGLVLGFRQARDARVLAEMDRDLAMKAEQEASESARKLVDTMYPQIIKSAWQSYRQGNSTTSSELLDSCPKRLRGWEWRFIQASLATQPFQTIRDKGQPAATRMDVLERWKLAAFVVEDGSVELRSLDRNEKRETLSGDFNANTVEFSPNGEQLFVGTIEGHLRIYQTNDWTQVTEQPLGLGGVYDIEFSPDGDRYTVCTGAKWVLVHQRATHEMIAKKILPERIAVLRHHPVDQSLVAAGMNGHLYQLKPESLEIIRDWNVSSASLIGLHWLNDSRAVALASGNVYALDLQAEALNREILVTNSRLASAFAMAPNDTMCIGQGDGMISAIHSNAPDETLASFDSSIQSIRWLPMKERLLITLADGRVVLGGATRSDSRRLFADASIAAGVMLPKHSAGAVLLSDGRLQFVHEPTGEMLDERVAHRDAPWAIATDRRQTILVTVGEDRRMCCWTLPNLELRFEAELDWGVRDVCVSPDGSWIAAASPVNDFLGQHEGDIGIWDTKTGQCVQILKGHSNWILRFAVASDGGMLASASVDRTARVWKTEDWQPKHVLIAKKQSTAEHVVFSPTADRLMIGHRDGWITSWKMKDGSAGPTWSAFGDALSGLVADHDRIIATSRSDARVRSRDLDLTQVATEIDLGLSTITNMQVAADGETFSFIDDDGRILIRRVPNTASADTGE